MKTKIAIVAALFAVCANAVTLQETIDATKPGDTVNIPSGTYHEKILIPKEKKGLRLVHEGEGEAIITWQDYAGMKMPDGSELGTFRSYTMKVEADDVELVGLTIVNTASDENVAAGGRGVGQAVALHIDADRVAVRKCVLKSYQDTLYTTQGVTKWDANPEYARHCRQYFEDCRIEGSVDFIFGQSTCLFHNCDLVLRIAGIVTAAATPEGQDFGYVFHKCRVWAPNGEKSMLGRPWRPHAQVVFVDCDMSDAISPEGWKTWRPGDGTGKTAYYGEFGCKGSGADVSQRPGWTHHGASERDEYFSARGCKNILRDVLKGDDGWMHESAAPGADDEWDWYEAKDLGLEGQIHDAEFDSPYDRFPKWAHGVAPENLWGVSRHSTGMSCRFVPHAKTLKFKWTTEGVNWLDPLMTPCALGGIDVYGWREDKGAWWFIKLGRGADKGEDRAKVTHRNLDVRWTPGMPCLVNLPLRAKIVEFKIGVPKGTKIDKAPAHKTAAKPVVIYGTSLVHGCNASRPGMLFSSIAARKADVEMVNLGFSGAAKMEMGMCDVLAGIDASLYILDALKNMSMDLILERYEVFVRELNRRRPDTPIILCEDAHAECLSEKSAFVEALFKRLKAEDPAKWSKLYLLPDEDMYPGDGEETVDGCHPNDWGMMHMGKAYAAKILEVLK